MIRPLCVGRPADWWDVGDDGNRLAVALCAVCPARRGDACAGPYLAPDLAPAGVVRAGVAYADNGRRLPACGTCGYPVADYMGGPVVCGRCGVPDVEIPDRKQVRNRQVRLLVAEGLNDKQLAAALGISPSGAEKARRRAGVTRKTWTKHTPRTGAAA